MAGLLLVLVAVGFLVQDVTGLRLDVEWVAPAALVAVGVTGLLSARSRRG